MALFPNNDVTRRFIAKHFRKRKTAVTEEAILDVLRAPLSKHDVYWSVLALRDVGTSRCIAALKELLHYPMQDVKDCSLLTIAHIAGAAETGFYVEALLVKGTKKGYPLWAIEVAADRRAIPAVVEYVEASLRKALRPKPADPGDAYLSGLKYLARMLPEAPEVAPIFAMLREAWPRLPEGHRISLRQAIPALLPG